MMPRPGTRGLTHLSESPHPPAAPAARPARPRSTASGPAPATVTAVEATNGGRARRQGRDLPAPHPRARFWAARGGRGWTGLEPSDWLRCKGVASPKTSAWGGGSLCVCALGQISRTGPDGLQKNSEAVLKLRMGHAGAASSPQITSDTSVRCSRPGCARQRLVFGGPWIVFCR